MVIIHAMDEVGECVVGVVDVLLALKLEVISFDRIEDFLLQDICSVEHLAPLLNLVLVVLYLPC